MQLVQFKFMFVNGRLKSFYCYREAMTRWLLHVLPLNPINKISKGNKSGLIPTIVTHNYHPILW